MKKYLIPIILIAFLSLCYYTFVQAASSGPNSPGTGANDAAVGTVAWTNPGSVLSNNGQRAVTISDSAFSNYLKATNFGFSIPEGATINGIVVEIEKTKSAGSVKDSAIKIVKSDGTIGTTNKADTGTEWPGADSYVTHGGVSDLWGETWTSTDINDIDFGVVVSVSLVDIGSAVAGVDHIRITVHYTEAAVAGTSGTALSVGSATLEVGNGVLQITN